MSNNAELHDREYIVPLFVLNAFLALTAVVLYAHELTRRNYYLP